MQIEIEDISLTKNTEQQQEEEKQVFLYIKRPLHKRCRHHSMDRIPIIEEKSDSSKDDSESIFEYENQENKNRSA